MSRPRSKSEHREEVSSHEEAASRTPSPGPTMQCCGNANISLGAPFSSLLFLAALRVCLAGTVPTVISNITLANQHAAEVLLGIPPMK